MEKTLSQENKEFPKRTDLQNRSLHKWCADVAETLNAGGIPYKLLIQDVQITHTMESTKNLFRLIAGAKFGVKTTTALSTKQLMDTWEDFNEILARQGVHVPFPSQDELNFKENYKYPPQKQLIK